MLLYWNYFLEKSLIFQQENKNLNRIFFFLKHKFSFGTKFVIMCFIKAHNVCTFMSTKDLKIKSIIPL